MNVHFIVFYKVVFYWFIPVFFDSVVDLNSFESTLERRE